MAKNVNSEGKVADLQIASNPAVLLSLTIHNSAAFSQFLQLHDAASTPANGAVPVINVILPATTSTQLEWIASNGREFDNGIYICNSSTDATKTIGAADLMIDVQVRGA